jgi:hypothetical protein
VGGAMLFRLAGWWFDPCLIPFAGYLLIISNFEFLAKMAEVGFEPTPFHNNIEPPTNCTNVTVMNQFESLL